MESTGYKSKLFRETDVAGTFEEVAQIAAITPPGAEADEAEIKELDGDGYKRTLPGLIDPGEVTLTLNFDPSNLGHTKFFDDAAAQVTRQYRIDLPPGVGKSYSFSAWVKSVKPSELGDSDVMQAEVTLRVTGAITIAATPVV